MPEEQKTLDWNALMEEALTAPGHLGNVYNRFHEYSYTNTLLFLQQGIREPVASFQRWRRLGRHVRKGARAKEVIVPIVVHDRAPEEETDEHPEETPKERRARLGRVIGYKLVRGIFALSDTAGPDLPPVTLPTWDLQTALDRLKIQQVSFDELNGNVQGYSRSREIAINPVAVHPEKTLFHELGHVVLGHTITPSLGEYAHHRGIMEFQAEATSYLSMNELGRMTPQVAEHSRGYIRHWLGSERPGEREIRLVFSATDQILKAGRGAVRHVNERSEE